MELKHTRHGPVIFEDAANHKAYALRAAWMEIGSAPYLASLRMNQARTWEEFREACGYSRMPAENMVWVDRTGTIGWQAAGIQPLRRNWSGLLPVPGDGRYEWDGYLPITALPHEVNPSRGFVATANHYLFPNDYAYPEAMHYEWADPYRASRIAECLGSGRLFSVAEMARLQNDDLSIPARALVPLLKDVTISNPAGRQSQGPADGVGLRDGQELGERWRLRHVAAPPDGEHARGDGAGPGARDPGQQRAVDEARHRLRCTRPTAASAPTRWPAVTPWWSAAWRRRWPSSTKRFGADSSKWQWGQENYHHALIRHPLSSAVNDATRAEAERGPGARGGDGSTVSATGGADNQTSGGSFKFIADTENWDNSIGLNNLASRATPTARSTGTSSTCGRKGATSPSRTHARRWSRSPRR